MLWYIYTRLSTSFFVHTGLYRSVYLGVDLSSDKMYEHAVKATEKLKAKEKEKLLQFRRNKKEKTQDREKRAAQQAKNPAEDGSGAVEGVEVSSKDIAQKA